MWLNLNDFRLWRAFCTHSAGPPLLQSYILCDSGGPDVGVQMSYFVSKIGHLDPRCDSGGPDVGGPDVVGLDVGGPNVGSPDVLLCFQNWTSRPPLLQSYILCDSGGPDAGVQMSDVQMSGVQISGVQMSDSRCNPQIRGTASEGA